VIEPRLLVPLSDSSSLRETVAYVIRQATERVEETGDPAEIHLVYPMSGLLRFDEEPREAESARTLLDRVEVWAAEDLGEEVDAVSVETALIGTDEYLFSPGDYADVIAGYARDHDLDLALLDPGFNPLGTTPLLPTLEEEMQRSGLDVRKAPVTIPRENPLLVRRGSVEQALALFGLSFLFYLTLAGSVEPFELVTGAITAGVVAASLWGVSLTTPLTLSGTATRLLRGLLFVPYLLWEITKANVGIAYVVLHPDLPIDPEVVAFDAAVWSALPVTTLANSITLTPGTLTVDVSRREFTVHTLTENSREDLLGGSLERAVRFVYYGRSAARIPSPRERGDERPEPGTDERTEPTGGDDR
jgi:multicomponent Na+:H+ antiporter subunit E